MGVCYFWTLVNTNKDHEYLRDSTVSNKCNTESGGPLPRVSDRILCLKKTN